MIEAVVFDLDDTLCSYRRGASELLEVAFAEVGVDQFFEVADYYGVYHEHATEADDIREIRERCFVDLAESAGRDPSLGRDVARIYSKERDQAAVEPLPGALEALSAIDHPLALVTNGPPDMQSTKLASLGIEAYFERVVYAGFETAAKPDPEPFRRALEAIDVPASRSVHVGNSLQSDVLGAANAGMRSVWVRQDGEWGADLTAIDAEPDHVVDSLHDLAQLPWG